MSKYPCPTCNRNFMKKCHLNDHLNKKNKCQPEIMSGTQSMANNIQMLTGGTQSMANNSQMLTCGTQPVINGIQMLTGGTQPMTNSIQSAIIGVQTLMDGIQIPIIGIQPNILINSNQNKIDDNPLIPNQNILDNDQLNKILDPCFEAILA